MPTTDIPSNTISPELAGNTPVIKLKSVVLPAPFGPITPNTSPCLTPVSYTHLDVYKRQRLIMMASIKNTGLNIISSPAAITRSKMLLQRRLVRL